ncbi:hypothetical protein AC623_20380 [Bacillus sp. FJAT-27231]|uniref:hypothetical protein n=1 Tax=Bacillus sp. FJAT-27231 TaxID=1679168 RepID=UPI000670B578|nr:hypothetical protein [Bacillus sp. FJAT-27231]KMY52502.1 hypothetical protein AC623_20380 [Bacillus sp. FJAT-27231]
MDGINLRRKKSWVFLSIIMFLFLGFFSFISSKAYMKEEQNFYHTELKKEISLTTMSTLRIESWEYNPKKNIMEILLTIDDSNDYTFEALSKANTRSPMSLKTIYHEQENYVLQIEDVPSNWEAIALDIYEVNKTDEAAVIKNEDEKIEEEREELIKTIYADQKKTKVNDELETKEKDVYAMYFIEMERTQLGKEIKKYTQAIQQEVQKKNELNKEIKELEKEKKYDTEIEKIDTETEIELKKDFIKECDLMIEDYEFEQKNAEEKIRKLNQKEQDLLKI